MAVISAGVKAFLNALNFPWRIARLGDRIQKLDTTGDLIGNVTGNVTGNLTGNVTGNTAGVHTGAVTGNVTGGVAVPDAGVLSFGTLTLTRSGNNLIAVLPSSDPHVAGALYVSSATVKVSAGA
jgi:hypothetical protein